MHNSASPLLTVILCGTAVMIVSGTLARLDAPPPDAAIVDVTDEGFDGELEGDEAVARALTGEMLVAVPDLDDPYFNGTKIYLIAHDESGAIGLVINRPVAVPPEGLEVFEGGPVGRDRAIVLHSDPARGVEVEPGVYAAADPSLIDDTLHGRTTGRVYVGYAGWGPGQLERELARGAWQVRPAFAHEPLGRAMTCGNSLHDR